MKEYHIFLSATEDYLNILKLHIKSLKYWKKKESKFIIHLFIDSLNISFFQNELKTFVDDTLKIEITSCLPYKNIIDVPKNNYWPYFMGIRLLIPKLFPLLNKILLLDCDAIFINKGFEEFLDDNFDNYYVNATLDILIMNSPPYLKAEYEESRQCQTKNYFNCGVCYLNLKKIRLDKKDILLAKAAIEYPINLNPSFFEQTIFNYIFRDKVKISDPKFNDMYLGILHELAVSPVENNLTKWNYKSVEDLLNKAIILHFAGPKPWKKYNEEFLQYPFNKIMEQKYKLIKQLLQLEV